MANKFEIIDHFTLYRMLGWEIIPLRPRSKIPLNKRWNREYDPESIEEQLLNKRNLNIGIRLGKIVDVEADNIFSNNFLTKLVHGCPHPQYKSKKSVHHLFLSPDKRLTRTTIKGIEFRGYKHQSALPPSLVGPTRYSWVNQAGFAIPPMPTPLLRFYRKHRRIPSSQLTQPLCHICENKSRPMHIKRHTLEVFAFKTLNMRWMCHKCRKIDIRPICRELKRKTLRKT